MSVYRWKVWCLSLNSFKVFTTICSSVIRSSLPTRVIRFEETVFLERNGLTIFKKDFLLATLFTVTDEKYSCFSFLQIWYLFLCFWNKRGFITSAFQKAVSQSTSNNYCLRNFGIEEWRMISMQVSLLTRYILIQNLTTVRWGSIYSINLIVLNPKTAHLLLC